MLTYAKLKTESVLITLQNGGYITDAGHLYGNADCAQKTIAIVSHEQMAVLKRDHGVALVDRPQWLLDLLIRGSWGKLATDRVWMLPRKAGA